MSKHRGPTLASSGIIVDTPEAVTFAANTIIHYREHTAARCIDPRDTSRRCWQLCPKCAPYSYAMFGARHRPTRGSMYDHPSKVRRER